MTTRLERIEAALDAALAMTFPASDPVALYAANGPRSPGVDDDNDRRATRPAAVNGQAVAFISKGEA